MKRILLYLILFFAISCASNKKDYIILGLFSGYNYRNDFKGNDLIESFYPHEVKQSKILYDLLKEKYKYKNIEYNVNNNGHIYLRNRMIKEYFNKKYYSFSDSHVRMVDKKNKNGKKTYKGYLIKDIYNNMSLNDKVDYFTGVFLRYGESNSIIIANSPNKIILIEKILIDTKNEIYLNNYNEVKNGNSREAFPTTYRIEFEMSDIFKNNIDLYNN